MTMKKTLGITFPVYYESYRQTKYAIDMMDKDFARGLELTRADYWNHWTDIENSPMKEYLDAGLNALFGEGDTVREEVLRRMMMHYWMTMGLDTIISWRGKLMHEAVQHYAQALKLIKDIEAL